MTTRGEAVVVDTSEVLHRPGGAVFDDVYRTERAAVVRLAALLVGSQAVAEELAHDAFLRLFERFDDIENPPGFLRTVVVRLAVSTQRRRRTELRVAQRLGVDQPTAIPDIDETWDVLQRLDPDRRTVLVLRYYERLRHREIAELLGCPVATVRSRTHRALKDLKKELTR
jgi:RNA polymerase sigma factor (sigma-70 family)